jgi:hypothetical protein
LDDYNLALKELEKAIRVDPGNEDLWKLYNNLKSDIETQSLGEKKVFKSFFRNVNKTYEEGEAKVVSSNDIGKGEVKLLDMYSSFLIF